MPLAAVRVSSAAGVASPTAAYVFFEPLLLTPRLATRRKRYSLAASPLSACLDRHLLASAHARRDPARPRRASGRHDRHTHARQRPVGRASPSGSAGRPRVRRCAWNWISTWRVSMKRFLVVTAVSLAAPGCSPQPDSAAHPAAGVALPRLRRDAAGGLHQCQAVEQHG